MDARTVMIEKHQGTQQDFIEFVVWRGESLAEKVCLVVRFYEK